MLNTVIDFVIFDDFCNTLPKQIPIGNAVDNDLWNSFWKYLKSGSNVTIANYSNQSNIFLNSLTTGRKGTNCKFDKYIAPHKYRLPKNQDIQTVFFLNEKESENQKQYRNKNGFIFGFINDYKEIWKEISFFEKETVLHARKSVEDSKMFSWDKFSKSILPFTDVIIIDNFLFKIIDEIEMKFGEILKALNKNSTKKFNLLLIINRFELDVKFNKRIEDLYDYLKQQDWFNPKKVNLSLVHTSKEHDRYIFFNYIEVGFGKIPDPSTKPTKITFNPYTISGNYQDSKIVLEDIERVIKNAKDNDEFVGNLSNGLLNCT